jgi:AraC family transcriptional regulator
MVGETVNQFIGRVRVEKAAALLLNNAQTSVTEIALGCGFSSSATFARAFRERFGMSASEWRKRAGDPLSNIRNMESKDRQSVGNVRKAYRVVPDYSVIEAKQLLWEVAMRSEAESKLDFKVEVKEMPDMTVAYVRHVGPYQGDSELFGRLIEQICTWAGPRGLLGKPDGKLLSVYHDSPEVTDESQLRVSVCITVPEDAQVDGEIGKMVIKGGTYAIGHFEIEQTKYGEAWDALMGGWLPESGYQPADGVCYEDYRNNPAEHPEGKCIVDICVPVKPL